MRTLVITAVLAIAFIALAPRRVLGQTDTTVHAAPPAQRVTSPPQVIVIRHPSVRNAYRVTRVLDDGGSVELDDGTVWAIYLPGRPTVDTWQVGDAVEVRRSSVTVNIGSTIFDHTLINGRSATHSRISARLVGMVAAGAQ